jgi:23S rRNA (guanosine2251-2'-O)-methyltransferase
VSSGLPFRATLAGQRYDAIIGVPVSVVLDSVRSLYNVGAFFRTLDAVAGEALYLAGITASPPDARIAKTALGADATVRWQKSTDVLALLAALRGSGRTIAAIETTSASVDLFNWQPAFPVCVVFGHEVEGLRPEVLDACDVHVRIPMLGRKESLNVATAGGVVLYELLRKYRGGSIVR